MADQGQFTSTSSSCNATNAPTYINSNNPIFTNKEILTATSLLSLLSYLPPQRPTTIATERIDMKDGARDLDALAEVLARLGEEVAVAVKHQRGQSMPVAYVCVGGEEKKPKYHGGEAGDENAKEGEERIGMEVLEAPKKLENVVGHLYENPTVSFATHASIIHRLLLNSIGCRRLTTAMRGKRLEDFCIYVMFRQAGKILTRLEAGRSFFLMPLMRHWVSGSIGISRGSGNKGSSATGADGSGGRYDKKGVGNYAVAKDEKRQLKHFISGCEDIKKWTSAREHFHNGGRNPDPTNTNDTNLLNSKSIRSRFSYRSSSTSSADAQESDDSDPEPSEKLSSQWPTLHDRLERNPEKHEYKFYDPRTEPDTAKEFHDLMIWLINTLDKAMKVLLDHQRRPPKRSGEGLRVLEQDIIMARYVLDSLADLLSHPSQVVEMHLKWVYRVQQVRDGAQHQPSSVSPSSASSRSLSMTSENGSKGADTSDAGVAPININCPSPSSIAAKAWAAACIQWLQTLVAPLHAAMRLHLAFRMSYMRCIVPKMRVIVLRHVAGTPVSTSSVETESPCSASPPSSNESSSSPTSTSCSYSSSNLFSKSSSLAQRPDSAGDQRKSALANWRDVIRSSGLDADAAEVVIQKLEKIASREGPDGKLWRLLTDDNDTDNGRVGRDELPKIETIQGNGDIVHPEAVLMALTFAAISYTQTHDTPPPFPLSDFRYLAPPLGVSSPLCPSCTHLAKLCSQLRNSAQAASTEADWKYGASEMANSKRGSRIVEVGGPKEGEREVWASAWHTGVVPWVVPGGRVLVKWCGSSHDLDEDDRSSSSSRDSTTKGENIAPKQNVTASYTSASESSPTTTTNFNIPHLHPAATSLPVSAAATTTEALAISSRSLQTKAFHKLSHWLRRRIHEVFHRELHNLEHQRQQKEQPIPFGQLASWSFPSSSSPPQQHQTQTQTGTSPPPASPTRYPKARQKSFQNTSTKRYSWTDKPLPKLPAESGGQNIPAQAEEGIQWWRIRSWEDFMAAHRERLGLPPGPGAGKKWSVGGGGPLLIPRMVARNDINDKGGDNVMHEDEKKEEDKAEELPSLVLPPPPVPPSPPSPRATMDPIAIKMMKTMMTMKTPPPPSLSPSSSQPQLSPSPLPSPPLSPMSTSFSTSSSSSAPSTSSHPPRDTPPTDPNGDPECIFHNPHIPMTPMKRPDEGDAPRTVAAPQHQPLFPTSPPSPPRGGDRGKAETEDRNDVHVEDKWGDE